MIGKIETLNSPDSFTVANFITEAATKNYKFRVCGIGKIDNKGTNPKGVLCTDLNLVASTACRKFGTVSDTFTVPDGIACLQWSNRENNLCVGDYGGKRSIKYSSRHKNQVIKII